MTRQRGREKQNTRGKEKMIAAIKMMDNKRQTGEKTKRKTEINREQPTEGQSVTDRETESGGRETESDRWRNRKQSTKGQRATDRKTESDGPRDRARWT